MSSPRMAIVGGGLAGLAAAVALVERGQRVELFEARKKLGGRAGSYVDRATGELIDHCQHVAMGCCTNYLDLCQRTGIAELFTRYDTLNFFGPDGRRSDFAPSRWLPPPLHLAGSLLRLKYLSLNDKLAIGRAMLRLMQSPPTDVAEGPPVLDWLRERKQSTQAIECFWQVVLVSALGESLDRASLAAARKVFLDGFLAHRDAATIYVPNVSLGELYDRRVAEWLLGRGAAIHLETQVAEIVGNEQGVSGVRLANGSEQPFDFVILAVPWRRVGELLPAPLQHVVDPQRHFDSIASAPISGVHLWFDRPITELPHAVLVGRLSQWVFARRASGADLGNGLPRPMGEGRGEGLTIRRSTHNPHPNPLPKGEGTVAHYYQVVISASHDLSNRSRQAVLDEVLADLRAIFPAAAAARLVRWQLVTEHDAVFSVRPGLDAIRPRQQTAIPNMFLAGDWTSTGWPATMEGAVRSGYLAAEGILAQLGQPEPIVVPDLPRGWMVRLMAR